jgi:hypothetical protein
LILEEGGLDLFLEVLVTFEDNSTFEQFVLILIADIAEVPQLRPRLMLPEFIARIRYSTAFSCAVLNVRTFLSVYIADDVSSCAGSYFIQTTSV